MILLISANLFAAGGVVTDPTEPATDRYVYYPGTEAQDKMLDKHMQRFNLENMDWRPEMYEKLDAE